MNLNRLYGWFADYLDKILKFFTLKEKERECFYCKKKFNGKEWKSFLFNKFVTVSEFHCSKRCERNYDKIINKSLEGRKLSNKENEIIKDVRYVEISIDKKN